MATNERRRVMLLTGASRGIGHATVKRFSAAGWRVITCSRHAFPENCPWEMGPEDHLQVDLADPADTVRGVEEVARRLDAEGACCTRSSTMPASRPRPGGRAARHPRHQLRRLAAGVPGQFLRPDPARRGLCDELTRARGSIVNVTSIAGSRVHPFAGAAYATSKIGARGLTREMAADFGPLGVRVNAISPGEIDTSILSPGTDKLVAQIPQRRLGTPDEVAKAIYFLCTEASSYVNGAELHINGGQHV